MVEVKVLAHECPHLREGFPPVCNRGVGLTLDGKTLRPHPINYHECPEGLGFRYTCQYIDTVPGFFRTRIIK